MNIELSLTEKQLDMLKLNENNFSVDGSNMLKDKNDIEQNDTKEFARYLFCEMINKLLDMLNNDMEKKFRERLKQSGTSDLHFPDSRSINIFELFEKKSMSYETLKCFLDEINKEKILSKIAFESCFFNGLRCYDDICYDDICYVKLDQNECLDKNEYINILFKIHTKNNTYNFENYLKNNETEEGKFYNDFVSFVENIKNKYFNVSKTDWDDNKLKKLSVDDSNTKKFTFYQNTVNFFENKINKYFNSNESDQDKNKIIRYEKYNFILNEFKFPININDKVLEHVTNIDILKLPEKKYVIPDNFDNAELTLNYSTNGLETHEVRDKECVRINENCKNLSFDANTMAYEILKINKIKNQNINFWYVVRVPPMLLPVVASLFAIMGAVYSDENNDNKFSPMIYGVTVAFVLLFAYMFSAFFDIFTTDVTVRGTVIFEHTYMNKIKWLLNIYGFRYDIKHTIHKSHCDIETGNRLENYNEAEYTIYLSESNSECECINLMLFGIYKLGLTNKIYNVNRSNENCTNNGHLNHKFISDGKSFCNIQEQNYMLNEKKREMILKYKKL